MITEEKKEMWRKDFENWISKANHGINDPEDLKNFTENLLIYCSNLKGEDYYEQTADSTKAMLWAVIQMCKKLFGLSLFQMGCILWDFIDRAIIEEHDVGMELVNYNNMLYPQYDYRFEKTITKETWEAMQQKAKELLENNKKAIISANEEVIEHWQSIIDGKVPFGYKVK